ncbi:MAG: hormogonium polysaccharide biosynthesis protein HpsA [Iphinoe sp. HA4291-MV1]|nr:hormogonium polysaccharide biosynthesis protein HpsA [Iphinoe sp. HA4291-MV1]
MSHYRWILKKINKFYRQIRKKSVSAIKKQILWLLRSWFVNKRKRRVSANSGFVLPTVAMVALVVVLLTTAILFRSFERSKHASNVRVNEAVLSAALPALERAKAKIEQLFGDSRLPNSTPSDFSLEQVINDNLNQFTFGDETQLKLVKEFNGKSNIQDEETLKTAWKYPVDTDNNGKFDSYTLYGIYFRTPINNKPKSFLRARTQPMDEGTECPSLVTTSANLVSTQGWYKVGDKLKKSIFVYTTTVPITNLTGLNTNKYETFTGNKGFAALEYQQDRARIPLSNNAVVYEDDLEIASEEGISLNGRILTNGNLLTKAATKPIRFYLVSSPKSCYFKEESSKIIVAGNVINSRGTENFGGGDVQVDLFDDQFYEKNSTIRSDFINNTNQTVPTSVYGNTAAYNDEAYAKRINRLVDATNNAYPNNTDLPDEVKQEIERDLDPVPVKVRDEKLRIYFKKRTRRVPYAEIAQGFDPLKYGGYDYETNSPLQGSGNSLKPVDAWVFPFNPADGKTATNYAEIGIKENGNKLYLPATDPVEQAKADKEQKIGDRILVGNNLPQLWFDTTKGKFVSSPDEGQTITGKEWDVDKRGNNSTVTRKRFSQAYQLEDLGATNRDGFWEKSAAQKPQAPLDVVGGLRVVTGAGIYVDGSSSDPIAYYPWDTDVDPMTPDIQPRSFFSASRPSWDTNFVDPSNTDPNRIKVNSLQFKGKNPIIVWSDSMPMTGGGNLAANPKVKGDLLMRATAVYFYKVPSDKDNSGKDQMPIACISSFYDPTNAITAQNQNTLLSTVNNPDADPTTSGKSNNGVVYPPYSGTRASAISTYNSQLQQQARLVFPDGRFVNELLRNALEHYSAGKPLSMADNSAIDTAVCAIQILNGSLTPNPSPPVPHRAIYETTFLDARQIKAIENTPNVSTFTLQENTRSVEERQPLEIRVTVLDLDKLRKTKIGTNTPQEYLIANSGIIYATRDDALEDKSHAGSRDVSATDFKLDPTRRPNAIMLINGSDLSRNTDYNSKKPEENEKGLILVSNLPVYIKGNFNVHTQEEFTDISLKGEKDWSGKFYARQSPNPDFACRKNQFPACNIGETWRSAVVIADAITVLSDNFRFGFRNEGDYDLRNNQGNIKSADYRQQGFFDNNFLTSSSWFDTSSDNNRGYPKDFDTNANGIQGSSYVNNFVTPIQRRVYFGEYVMEICRKAPVSECIPDDWKIGFSTDSDLTTVEQYKKANQIPVGTEEKYLVSGTTARVANNAEEQRYARRVAFLREPSNKLILDKKGAPVPIGVDKDGKLAYYPYNELKIPFNKETRNFDDSSSTIETFLAYNPNDANKRPRYKNNALWFRTTNDTSFSNNPTEETNYGKKFPLFYLNKLSVSKPAPAESDYQLGTYEQPLLVPVLQIHMPYDKWTSSSHDPGDDRPDLPTDEQRGQAKDKNWLQQAIETTTNLVIAGGDTPGRPTESNGGLENFVRYLEKWREVNTDLNHNISGSIIQYKRSTYATAPWQTVSLKGGNAASTSLFGSDYRQFYRTNTTPGGNTGEGMSPFYTVPARQWSYDVALLSQSPDLFSLHFTTPTMNEPNEFYREVGRDDAWVQTLLCAQEANGSYAVSQDQRGTCP